MVPILLCVVLGLLFSAPRIRAWVPTSVLKPLPLTLFFGFFSLFAIFGPVMCVKRHMIYHDEPSVVSVAVAALHGQPLYHSADAAQRYSLLYGPATFWLYTPPALFGRDLRLFQLWVILPLAAAVFSIWKVAGVARSRTGQAIVSFIAVILVLAQANNEWAMKGDAWLLCVAAVQLAASVLLNGPIAWFAIALCGAVLVDIKITSIALASVPLWIYARRTARWPYAILSAALLVGFASAAFLVKGVSLSNYLFWLRQSSRHGIAMVVLRRNMAYLASMTFLPGAIYFYLWCTSKPKALAWVRARKDLLVLGAIATASLLLSGAKRGAGPWHCAPLIPMFTLCAAGLWRELDTCWADRSVRIPDRRWLVAFVFAWVLAGLKILRFDLLMHWRGTIPETSNTSAASVADDLRQILHDHPGQQIQMGYGAHNSYELTWQRPLLVLYGNRYDIDADSMMEMQTAGLSLPAATIQNIRDCANDIWLIPRGDAPFSLENGYSVEYGIGPRDVFPESFRAAFLRHYHPASHSRYFDLWTCMR